MSIPLYGKCNTVAEYITLVQSHPSPHWVYRGQSDATWPLKPKAGRYEYFQPQTPERVRKNITHLDLGQFKVWCDHAIAYCDKLPEHEIERLAYAQHYGLATRLLDWTANALVALYFAVEDHSDKDGAVYCYIPWFALTESSALDSVTAVARYTPRPFDRRILAQSGEFTYHPEPDKAIVAQAAAREVILISPTKMDLVQILVPSRSKIHLRKHLVGLGVSRKMLFPDLEGLSCHVNWDMRRSVAWHHNPDNPRNQEME